MRVCCVCTSSSSFPSNDSYFILPRTIIDVVEQSVELVRRSLQLQRASKNSSNKDSKKQKQHSVQLESVDTIRPQPTNNDKTNHDNLYKGIGSEFINSLQVINLPSPFSQMDRP